MWLYSLWLLHNEVLCIVTTASAGDAAFLLEMRVASLGIVLT